MESAISKWCRKTRQSVLCFTVLSYEYCPTRSARNTRSSTMFAFCMITCPQIAKKTSQKILQLGWEVLRAPTVQPGSSLKRRLSLLERDVFISNREQVAQVINCHILRCGAMQLLKMLWYYAAVEDQCPAIRIIQVAGTQKKSVISWDIGRRFSMLMEVIPS